MRPLEIAFVLIACGFLIAQSVRGPRRTLLFALAVAGVSTVLASSVLGQVRWQMTPAYLLFVVLLLLLLRRAFSHVAVRSLGIVLGILLLAITVVASVGLPILTLPAPDGPHVVGSTSVSLIDKTRDNSFFDAPNEERELYVQVWYPGTIAAGDTPQPRTLWEELYRGDLDRFTVFSSYLRGTKTHSYDDIPLSPIEAYYPTIVFSHAMGSFAEQNTMLMEHLASHGYVVVGISHPYTSMRVVSSEKKAIYLNLDKINKVSAQFKVVSADLAPRIERSGSAEERNRLNQELYEQATGNNALMAIWVDDIRFVLDSITGSQPGTPQKLQTFANRIDADRIGLLGMSFGGGAITEVCKSDTRCRAGMNMDGPTFGQRQRQPLEVPYLALIRENQTSLDYLLAASHSDYYQVEVKGATHLDFTDDTVVLPIMKWMHVTGRIAGWRAIEIANVVSLRFFDTYLRGGPKPRFNAEFPELTIETNDRASQ